MFSLRKTVKYYSSMQILCDKFVYVMIPSIVVEAAFSRRVCNVDFNKVASIFTSRRSNQQSINHGHCPFN